MSSPESTRRSRWLRLSIRGLLLAVTVLCVLFAYVGVRLSAARRQAAAAKAVESAGGGVQFNYPLRNNLPSPPQAAWVPQWLQKRVGRHFFESVQTVYFGDPNGSELPPVGDDAMKLLQRFPDLRQVCLWATDVTDRGLAPLENQQDLHCLIIWRNKHITDDGLRSVQRLRRLHSLEIYGRQITDEGLKHVGQMQSLSELHLSGVNATDEGLAQLAGLGNLKELVLDNTRVTPAGAQRLQQSLPKCHIVVR